MLKTVRTIIPRQIRQRLTCCCLLPVLGALLACAIFFGLTFLVIRLASAQTPGQSQDILLLIDNSASMYEKEGVGAAWLMSQATPSWNLDRARLPDGGSSLQRLEVLGVPDDTNSVFSRHAAALVSTGDPARITAFVAHIGAPHSGLQQWDSYHAAYDQIRGHVPLHILPEFQADNEHARQTFALGSLFGFIFNQGAYFYYKSADHLDRPVKLGQGLENSLQTFTGKDGLVQETRERIEQIVASRGVNTVLDILGKYYDAPPGRHPADDLILELKRLVRAYAGELRQIHQFAAPSFWPPEEDEPANGNTPTEPVPGGQTIP